MVRRNLLPQYSESMRVMTACDIVDICQRFRATFTVGVRMEATGSTEIFVTAYKTRRRHNLEEHNLNTSVQFGI
jgi:hypothetical protein